MIEEPIIPAQGKNGLEHSPTLAELAKALAAAQGEMEGAKKDSANPFYKSKYADLAAVVGSIRGPFSRNGLAHIQSPGSDETGEYVDTMFIHASGEWMRGRIRMRPVKDDPQGIGSVITYMRRYALQSMAGLEAEDDDGNNASDPQSRKPALKPLPEGSYENVPSVPRPEQPKQYASKPEDAAITKWQDRISHAGKIAKGKRLGDLSNTVLESMYEAYKDKDCSKIKDDALLKAALVMWRAENSPKGSQLKQEMMEVFRQNSIDHNEFGAAMQKADLIKSRDPIDYSDYECKFVLENWKDCHRTYIEYIDDLPK